MSEDELEEFERSYLIEKGFLLAEHREANQEYRHRDRLIHSTFYLLIVAIGVFTGIFIQYGSKLQQIEQGALVVAAGIVASIIGHLFLKHYHERSSAQAVRMHAEWVANGRRSKAKRALSLTHGTVGMGAKFDDEKEKILKRGSYMFYILRFPEIRPSAEVIGLLLIYLGIFIIVGGAWVFVSSFADLFVSVLSSVVIGFVVATLYFVAARRSTRPNDEEIY